MSSMKDKIYNGKDQPRITSYSSTDGINESQRTLKSEVGSSTCCIKKRYIFIIIGILSIIATILYLFGGKIFAGIMRLMIAYSNWMTENIAFGLIIYMLIFVTGMVCLIPPGFMVAIGAFTFVRIYGHVYGLLLLTGIVYITTHTGIYLTYFIGRHGCSLGHKLAQKIKHFEILNHLVKTRGIKITVLLRIVQVVPYPIINYIMSTTDIPHWDYFIGNHACITDAILHAYIGLSMNICEMKDGKCVSSGDVESNDTSTIAWKIAFALVGLIVLSIVLFFVIRIARRELDEMIEKEEKMTELERSDSEEDQNIGDDEELTF